MARTMEKARKYAQIKAPNGYKFNISRYLYGCSIGDEYPSLIKEVGRDDNYIYYKQVYFFKHYNKTASIYVENYSRAINGGEWQIVNSNPCYSEEKVESLPQGTRFDIKLLFKYCN